MYYNILIAAGYTLHNTINKSACWIKEGKPDINICQLTGFWAADTEPEDETTEYGSNERSLRAYLS